MKNKKTLISFSLVALTTLAGCQGSKKTKVEFWTGFGAAVNGVLEPLLARFEEQNPDIDVVYETKGGYPNLQQAIKSSISNSAFPHIANGYPDHFADYANSQVLINLAGNDYINGENGLDVSDFYQDYMHENTNLVDGATVGLPFNKSTEIMVANQTFFDVAKTFDETIAVPTTWQELAVVGPKIKAVAKTNAWFGKFVKSDGTTVEKDNVTTADQNAIVLDLTNVADETKFTPFSWDSTSNFFITILRQWGSVYTERGATLHTGYIRFQEDANRAKTVAALQFFKDLYVAGIVGIPETFGESNFASKPFREGRVVLTISSSAGVKENLPDAITDYPFGISVNPIPFNGDLPTNKYVISQGTNLALFRRGKAGDEKTKKERQAAWKLLKYLVYEVNHEFGKGTSYFPVTDGSKLEVNLEDQRYNDYKLYTDFLAETGGTNSEKAVRATANLQEDVYMNASENWLKFVDPGFLGSSTVRDEANYAMGKLFAGGMNPDEVIASLISNLGDYIEK